MKQVEKKECDYLNKKVNFDLKKSLLIFKRRYFHYFNE